jgi:hypothetical protein
VDSINKEEIFDIFAERLEDGIWFILALKEKNKPILKDHLKDEVNELYIKKMTANRSNTNVGPLITSRYILDRYTNRLEGAGLVNVENIGKARLYSLSNLAYEFIDYTRRKRSAEHK